MYAPALVFALALLGSCVAMAEEPPTVRYDAGRVSVQAASVPVSAILDELARQSGASLRGTAPATPVTTDFTGLSLPEALGRLLGDGSFVLHYEGSRLRAIELLAAGATASPATVSPAPGTPAASRSPRGLVEAERQARVLQRGVPVTGALAKALATSTPSAGALLHTALQSPSAEIRAAARRAILAAFAADAELEDAYLSTLTPVADATLATMLRRMAKGDGAEALMSALAGGARSAALRVKAAAVLAALRATPANGAAR